MYYDNDADLSPIQSKTVAIIGYGSQGHAHAQNLRDSGVEVVVGELQGTRQLRAGRRPGFKVRLPPKPRRQADIIMILVPDQTPGRRLQERRSRPNLKAGKTLIFSHGFNIHFGQIVPPADVDVFMIAPKGPGHLVRDQYRGGHGVPCLIAVHQNASGKAREQRPRLRQGHRRPARRRHRDHLQGRDRDRPLRRAGRPLRRRHAS